MAETHDTASAAPDRTGDSSRGRVLVLIDDLIFGSKVREALRRLGVIAVFPASVKLYEDTLGAGAALLILDVDAPRFSPEEAIRMARTAGVPVLAYGSHVNVEALAAARRAGADEVVPRSVFASQLPQLVEALLGNRTHP